MLAQMLMLYFQSLLVTSLLVLILGVYYYYQGLSNGIEKRTMRHEVLIASCLVIPIFSFAVMALLIVF